MQKYYYKVYLFENGKKTIDYSANLVSPIYIEERLDESLDTGEIILDKMPIESKNSFPPKTKIRIERYTTPDFSNALLDNDVIDMVVEHDDVEEYAGCPNLCCHRIHLIEPSVIAQGMHVDNISLTYELNDVNLNYKVSVDSIETVKNNGLQILNAAPSTTEYINFSAENASTGTYYKANSYLFKWEETESFANVLKYRDAMLSRVISFTLPRLKCYHYGNLGALEYLFDCPIKVEVIEHVKENGSVVSSRKLADSELTNFRYNPTEAPNRNDNIMYNTGSRVGLRAYEDESYTEDATVMGYYIDLFKQESKFPAILDYSIKSYTNRDFSFRTSTLSSAEMSKGRTLHYEINILANPYLSNSMVSVYKKKAVVGGEYSTAADWTLYILGLIFGAQLQKHMDVNITTEQCDYVDLTRLKMTAEVICRDASNETEGGPLIAKGVPYNCFDLLRKSLLTIDSQVIDNSLIGLDENSFDDEGNEIKTGIEYPIVISPKWENRLKSSQMFETIFENKNLWEIFLQIGYYLHAIPYLRFAEDGTDRFLLEYRQLGDSKEKKDNNNKITIFNSLVIHDYFSQYDSYVTNIFSPQNEVEEWVSVKTSDSSMLVSNNTAEIQLSYPITELLEFDIYYNGENGGTAGTKSALNHVFEKSIYQILSNDNPNLVFPCKGTSLFFEIATNKIQGLTFVPPPQPVILGSQAFPMALKKIVGLLWEKENNEAVDIDNLKFNNLRFHIKYKTQDSLRLSQIRPDLQKFMKNSSYEKYPHHEQFYGQQDKIVDSERFSANLFGKLVRVGNGIYQRQEYCPDRMYERQAGDMVLLNSEPYFVTETQNEWYADALFQKVTYSKNYNQLSQVVSIPSEPRFYEVSERSKIRREVRIMDFFELSSIENETSTVPRFLSDNVWKDFLKQLLFGEEKDIKLPNYAWTRFKADKKRSHRSNSGEIKISQLFPSSELARTYDENGILTNLEPKAADDHTDTIVPLLHFPLHDGIVFEWDMADNFKSGDFIDDFNYGEIPGGTEDDAYLSQQSYRYCDVMGRADLFQFKLFNKSDFTSEEMQALPRPVVEVTDDDSFALVKGGYNMAIGLDKDGREELSFNYQINLLHKGKDADKNDFITFPNLFGKKDNRLRMQIQAETKSMFDENVDLSSPSVLLDEIEYKLLDAENSMEIKITQEIDRDVLSRAKSIILYNLSAEGQKTACIVKNLDGLSEEEKLKSWWIFPVYTD